MMEVDAELDRKIIGIVLEGVVQVSKDQDHYGNPFAQGTRTGFNRDTGIGISL
jgi:hypothetical protein